ncbi:MAG: class I SAM-dependent methyltransferase [Methanobrevibacter sp.]|jgi:SAM-dependent methyltransferase|nr:class I SAM-dependent methyltransferase [Candidatus Methanoflexus mossambicus]
MKWNIIRFLNKVNKATNLYLKNFKLEKKNRNKFINENSKNINKTNEKLNQIISLQKQLNSQIKQNKSLLSLNLEKTKNIEALLINNLDSDDKVYCPFCKKHFWTFLPFGENPRKNAQCPSCSSLERHRLVYLFFKNLGIFNKESKFVQGNEKLKLLHFAPEPLFYNLFSKLENVDYYPVDINQNMSNVRLKVDMQDIPFEDNTFDFVYTSHVLEHVPNDRKAMSELYRVVKPFNNGGKVVIMVPIDHNREITFEKEEYNTPELRSKYYGQRDHLRIYGNDFVDRLRSVGFNVEIFDKNNFKNDPNYNINSFGIVRDEIFACKKLE